MRENTRRTYHESLSCYSRRSVLSVGVGEVVIGGEEDGVDTENDGHQSDAGDLRDEEKESAIEARKRRGETREFDSRSSEHFQTTSEERMKKIGGSKGDGSASGWAREREKEDETRRGF